jgi:hypothetical protein|uniref:Uncharacterized protein n=1 Tax=Globisporangium ultimum (strain ATCC 200006 / CBS 805.95 / DAOM BR144) TaxID=431595 RepID=K3XBY5_GLOUD
MRAAASTSPRALSLRSMALSLSSSGVLPDVTEIVLDVFAWLVVLLLAVTLYQLHKRRSRRSGYSEIPGSKKIAQDDHVLYSQALMGTKDSWENIPLTSPQRT